MLFPLCGHQPRPRSGATDEGRWAQRQMQLPRYLVLFDGVCNLCTRSVQFIIKHDKNEEIHFASIQSDAGKRIYTSLGLDANTPDTMVFCSENKIFTESDAAIEVAARFGGLWCMARALSIIPRTFRDCCYRTVARNRYRWFGTRDTCMISTESVSKRFLA